MSRIQKVKRKDGVWTIVEIEGEGSTVESETVHKISDEPHPDLPGAMADLVPHARKILEWPSSYAEDRISVSSVSFSKSESTGAEGAVITGSVTLLDCDTPFSWNTPHLTFDNFSKAAHDALENLRTEAAKFLNGKRAQGNLFEVAA